MGAGWDRYDTHEAVAELDDLYRNELRLWMNLFLPALEGAVPKKGGGGYCRSPYAISF